MSSELRQRGRTGPSSEGQDYVPSLLFKPSAVATATKSGSASPMTVGSPFRSPVGLGLGGRALPPHPEHPRTPRLDPTDDRLFAAPNSGRALPPVRSMLTPLALDSETHGRPEETSAWSCWVVVFGYAASLPPGRLFDLMGTYGNVLEYARGSAANSTLFRYAQANEAARAAAALNGSFLAADSMVAVLQLNPALARQANLRLDEEGLLRAEAFGQGEGAALLGMHDGFGSRKYVGSGLGPAQRDVFRTPAPAPQPRSVCARLMEYFFFY